MNLQAYLEDLPTGGKSGFAKQLGIAPTFLYQLMTGIRPISCERAIQIERETEGRVRVEEMRPDVEWAVVRNG